MSKSPYFRHLIAKSIREIVGYYPALYSRLSAKARFISARPVTWKTYDYYLKELERMVRNVYGGKLGGEFIDIMASLIQGQITQAFEQAWKDAELKGGMPEYMTVAANEMILDQYNYVDQFYRDIVDARVDETPIEPLLARCPMWANRWNEAYSMGTSLIVQQMGGKQIWKLGATEEHCATCYGLNGIVAYASEWAELGVHPQGAPNALLECGGWRCDCQILQTDKRRSPDAYGSIMNIISAGHL